VYYDSLTHGTPVVVEFDIEIDISPSQDRDGEGDEGHRGSQASSGVGLARQGHGGDTTLSLRHQTLQ